MGKANSKLSLDQLNDLSKQTNFDKKEITNWYRGFLGDFPAGHVDRSGFQLIYKQYFPFGNSSKYVDFVFSVFDTDKNGIVDFREFMTALSVTTRGTLDEKLEWSFRLYDVDGDGWISRDEMLSVVDAIYEMTSAMVEKLPDDEDSAEKRVDKIYTLMDLDNDGRLSRQEFYDGSKRDPSLLQALSVYEGLL